MWFWSTGEQGLKGVKYRASERAVEKGLNLLVQPVLKLNRSNPNLVNCWTFVSNLPHFYILSVTCFCMFISWMVLAGARADNGFLLLRLPWDPRIQHRRCHSCTNHHSPWNQGAPSNPRPKNYLFFLHPNLKLHTWKRRNWKRSGREMSKISVATLEVPLDRLSSAQLELKRLSGKKLERGRLSSFGRKVKNKNGKPFPKNQNSCFQASSQYYNLQSLHQHLMLRWVLVQWIAFRWISLIPRKFRLVIL